MWFSHSFAIINDNDHFIVNMNDCVPHEELYKIKKIINKLSHVFTNSVMQIGMGMQAARSKEKSS